MIRRIVIVAGVGVVLVGGYVWLRGQGSVFEQEGKLATARVGTVKLQISASGVAREALRVEIKSKASGTVQEIAVKEGDAVKKGQLLIKLDPKDEQTRVDAAQSEFDQAQAALAVREAALQQALEDYPINVERAKANVQLTKDNLKIAESKEADARAEFERIDRLYKAEQASYTEWLTAKRVWNQARSALAGAKHNVAIAEAELKQAETGDIAIERARHEVRAAHAALKRAEHMLNEAKDRLRETTILSPIDGRVVRINVAIGQVISSGITTIGGGTVLMVLADTSQVVVEADVDEADIDKVTQMVADAASEAAGQGETDTEASGGTESLRPDEGIVTFDALEGVRFVGRITEIAQEPELRSNIATYKVRLKLRDHPMLRRVRLGMQATVEFKPRVFRGLCVPYRAVHKKARDLYVVYVPEDVDGDGRLDDVERPVQIGPSDGEYVIIKSGLKPGEKVYEVRPRRIRPRTKKG